MAFIESQIVQTQFLHHNDSKFLTSYLGPFKINFLVNWKICQFMAVPLFIISELGNLTVNQSTRCIVKYVKVGYPVFSVYQASQYPS